MADPHPHAELTELFIKAGRKSDQPPTPKAPAANASASIERVPIGKQGYILELSDRTVVRCMDDTPQKGRHTVAE